MGRKRGLKGQNRAVEGRENVVIKPFSPSVEGVGKKGVKRGRKWLCRAICREGFLGVLAKVGENRGEKNKLGV